MAARKLVTTTVRSGSSGARANINATYRAGMHTGKSDIFVPEVAPVTIIIGGGSALPRPLGIEQKKKAHPQPATVQPHPTRYQARKQQAAGKRYVRGNVAKLVGVARLAAASAAVPAVVKGKPVRVVQLSRKVGKRAKAAADDALVALAAALAADVQLFKHKRGKGAK